MKDIFYELIMVDFFVRKRQEYPRRRTAKKRAGFEKFGIVERGMERAGEFMQMVMAEVIMKDNGCPDEDDEEKNDESPPRAPA
jgi:hypothetical protein